MLWLTGPHETGNRNIDADNRVHPRPFDAYPTGNPKGVHRLVALHVPIDFTKDDLQAVLDRAGYDSKKKTIFVWEGVTFYIPESAVDSTLRFVAGRSAPGSRIVFDYFLETALKSPGVIAFNKRLSAMGDCSYWYA